MDSDCFNRFNQIIIMNYYNEIAEGYEELHKEEQLKKLDIINSLLKEENIEVSPDARLLDVGCGTGISTRFWDFAKCERIGIDPAEKLIEMAQMKDLYGQYFVESAEEISFEDELFDFVTCITAIHNFKNLDLGLEEIKRVGKDIFIFSVLKKAVNFENIMANIRNNFSIIKEHDEEKDKIIICKKA